MPEQTEYWGIVNGKTYANGDIAEAVRLAQENGKKTVSIPAGTYRFNASKVIDIYTSGFTLVGAGVGSTILEFSDTCDISVDYPPCGIRVKPREYGQLIENVRLTDFSIRKVTDITPAGSQNRRGGIYLQDCRGAVLERVNADLWDWNDPYPPGYGFKVYHNGASSAPAGKIMFYRCGGVKTTYGIWLAGSQPVQRCSIIGPSFSPSGDITNWIPNSIGIYVEKAKSTLMFGGEFGAYQYGIKVAPPSFDDDNETCQIFGVKFDNVDQCVYIGDADSIIHPKKTQVFGMANSRTDNQVIDYGEDSLVISHSVEDTPYPANNLILSRTTRSQFPLSVNVRGRVEVFQEVGYGIRTYKTAENGLTVSNLDTLFGEALAGFVGIFENQDPNDLNTYLIVKSGGSWYSAALNRVE